MSRGQSDNDEASFERRFGPWKHVTWSMCFCFTLLHSVVVSLVLGLVYLVILIFTGFSGEFPETLLYLGGGMISFAPFFGTYWAYVYVARHNRRVPFYYCKACGYNLTGNVSGFCTECGRPIPNHTESDTSATED